MDVDIVLNEVCEDDDAVTVEFSQGPEAFKARCEARSLSLSSTNSLVTAYHGQCAWG